MTKEGKTFVGWTIAQTIISGLAIWAAAGIAKAICSVESISILFPEATIQLELSSFFPGIWIFAAASFVMILVAGIVPTVAGKFESCAYMAVACAFAAVEGSIALAVLIRLGFNFSIMAFIMAVVAIVALVGIATVLGGSHKIAKDCKMKRTAVLGIMAGEFAVIAIPLLIVIL